MSVLYWIQGMLLTFDQHIPEIGLPPRRIKNFHVEKQDLGVWVGALDIVVFGL